MRKLPFNAGVIIIKPQAKLDAIVRRKVELVVGLQVQLALAHSSSGLLSQHHVELVSLIHDGRFEER